MVEGDIKTVIAEKGIELVGFVVVLVGIVLGALAVLGGTVLDLFGLIA